MTRAEHNRLIKAEQERYRCLLLAAFRVIASWDRAELDARCGEAGESIEQLRYVAQLPRPVRQEDLPNGA